MEGVRRSQERDLHVSHGNPKKGEPFGQLSLCSLARTTVGDWLDVLSLRLKTEAIGSILRLTFIPQAFCRGNSFWRNQKGSVSMLQSNLALSPLSAPSFRPGGLEVTSSKSWLKGHQWGPKICYAKAAGVDVPQVDSNAGLGVNLPAGNQTMEPKMSHNQDPGWRKVRDSPNHKWMPSPPC